MRFRTLSHSKFECKYHVVWIPKFRRKSLYGEKRQVVINSIRKWAKVKEVEIIEGHACADHIHMCLSISPKYSISSIMGTLKGKSAAEVMCFGNKSSKMSRGRNFWARGYCVSTVGLDEKTIREYIKNQESEDKKQDQFNLL